MNKHVTVMLIAVMGLTCTLCPGEIKSLSFRTSAQKEIATEDLIVDGQWIVIGSAEKRGAKVTRDTDNLYKGQPVYHFSAVDDSVNRIEFSEAYGSTENLKSFSEAEKTALLAINDGYINSDNGQFGDTVTYEWSTRFPGPLTPDSHAIFAQWHGRPDRTLIQNEDEVRILSPKDFIKLKETIDFKEDGWGFSRKTGEKTTLRMETAAGGPIGAFKIGMDHMYLLVRSDASRRSDFEVKLKPKPSHDIGHIIRKGNKEAALVWKLPLSQVPINKWINFKVRIHYSEYDANADKVLTPGQVNVWMNGEQVADWKGNVGKNDIHGPYFKFGIYKPCPTGFKVDHAAYKRTIERTRKNPVVSHPLK